MKRKKRLEKGIESMKKQIEIHEDKLINAKNEKNLDLEDYYTKEILSKKQDLERKKELLRRE